MLRTWKIFGLPSILAVTLAAAPIVKAQDDDTKAQLKKITRTLETIEVGLEAIQRDGHREKLRANGLDTRLKSLEERLARMETTLEALQKPKGRAALYPPESLDDIKVRLEQIERMLERGPRIARSAPSTGRILLTNHYPEDMTFIVNGLQYTLAPNTSRLLDGFPSGNVTYQVFSPSFGERANKTTALQAEETFRITVN